MKKMIWIMGTLNPCNGITSYAMNYYRELRNDFLIDFIIHDSLENSQKYEYYNEIMNSRSKIYFLGQASLKNVLKLKPKIRKIYEENKYDAIHCHLTNLCYFYLKEAKRFKISIRIVHSHATQYAEKKFRKFRNYILVKQGLKYATHYCSCSKSAGRFLFKKNKFTVIKNGVDSSKFYVDSELRKSMRKQYNCENKIILGHIGRFSEQKNHKFIIDVFDFCYSSNKNLELFLVGDGPLYDSIVEYAKTKASFQAIKFLGLQTRINELLNMFDLFILPSLFEGFPVVTVEAQFVGVPIIQSTNITEECIINPNVIALDLNIDEWAQEILKCKNRNVSSAIFQYEITNCSVELKEYYNSIILETED